MTKTLFWAWGVGRCVTATLLAFDDTDSPEGMCTTYLATLMIEELSQYSLIGPPRLVRLNPNIPWKTRGNAAICLGFGIASGNGKVCGEIEGKPVLCYDRGRPVDPEILMGTAKMLVEKMAKFECDKTNPGIVVSRKKPSQGLYWRTVRGITELRDVERTLASCGATWKRFKNGRGVIGASAAMSWRPRDRTWEVIAYREPSRWGTSRSIDAESVKKMDRSTARTFNNYDYVHKHVAIAPGSPCPILFGIRGDSPAELLKARKMIRAEKQDRWLLFMTNQATEDHIVDRMIGSLQKWESARVRARVVAPPKTVPGGHVIVRVSDGDEIDAAFYEPSKEFREIGRSLRIGDEVLLYGSVRDVPRSLNVEKVRVLKLAQELEKVHNPSCRKCGKRMGSLGAGKGYRCKRCGRRAPEHAAEMRKIRRELSTGWYEPPVASRRHLHKPLRRLSRVNIDSI